MKALRTPENGQPDVLYVDTLATPVPGPGEVLVKVAAAAINPSDIKNVAGLFQARLPASWGGISRAPSSVKGPTKGARSGAAAPASASSAMGRRRNMSACLPTGCRTNLKTCPWPKRRVSVCLSSPPGPRSWRGGLQPGETVLITGSTGAVGRAAIQIARWKGARVIGLGDRPSDADLYINAETTDLHASVVEATGGAGVDMVLDVVGGPMFEPALGTLRQGGRQIAIASAETPRVTFNLIDFYHRQLHLAGVDTMKLRGNEIAAILDDLRPGFVTGALSAPDLDLSTLEAGPEVYEAVRAGRAGQKQGIGFA